MVGSPNRERATISYVTANAMPAMHNPHNVCTPSIARSTPRCSRFDVIGASPTGEGFAGRTSRKLTGDLSSREFADVWTNSGQEHAAQEERRAGSFEPFCHRPGPRCSAAGPGLTSAGQTESNVRTFE